MAKKTARMDLYDENKNFGKLLKQLRVDKKLGQREVAEYLGVKIVTVSAYESGRIKPTPDKIYKLSQLFGVSIDVMSGKLEPGSSSFDREIHDNTKEEMLYYFRNLSEPQQRALLTFVQKLADQ